MIHPAASALGRCFNALMGTDGRGEAKSIPVPEGSFAMERSQSNNQLPLKGAIPLPKPTCMAWFQSSSSAPERVKPAEKHLTTKVMNSVSGSIPGAVLHRLRAWSVLVQGTGQDHIAGTEGMRDGCFYTLSSQFSWSMKPHYHQHALMTFWGRS